MLHIEKNMCTKRDKKQNTFKLTNTSNPHKIIVKLKVQTAYSDNQTDISHSVVNIHCINNSVCVPLFVSVNQQAKSVWLWLQFFAKFFRI